MKYVIFATLGFVVLTCESAPAQHADVLLVRQGDKIVTGTANLEDFVWTVGSRVFARDFDSDYEIDNPGFNALSATSPFMPPGYSALPISSDVHWDFLPMTVPSVKANLLYWNGLDGDDDNDVLDIDDVNFSTLPSYTLAIDGIGGVASADGSDEIIEGSALVRTDSTGSIHTHRDFTLDDGDGNFATNPVDGIYLIALRVKMEETTEELEASKPFFLVFGSWQSPEPLPAATLAARNLAVSWVTQRVESLVVDRIPGDYNDDGIVDAADYAVWRDTLGSTMDLVADGDTSEAIDMGDYGIWRENFGTGADLQLTAVAIPEPSSLGLLLFTAYVFISTPFGRLLRRRA